MTNREIKANLVLAGVTHSEIARRAQVDISLVTRVIQYKRKNHKVRLTIARAIGKPWREIFIEPALKAA